MLAINPAVRCPVRFHHVWLRAYDVDHVDLPTVIGRVNNWRLTVGQRSQGDRRHRGRRMPHARGGASGGAETAVGCSRANSTLFSQAAGGP